MKKLNCWEVKKCSRGKQNGKTCPAVTEHKLHGVHGGTRGGRACWVVAGTFCGGEEQGTYATKYHNCEKCDFYQRVKQEEGSRYQYSNTLRQKLKQNETVTDS